MGVLNLIIQLKEMFITSGLFVHLKKNKSLCIHILENVRGLLWTQFYV